ncbi:hypothetical protein Hanom_Chr06g00504821 [Helianthus anomalus]
MVNGIANETGTNAECTAEVNNGNSDQIVSNTMVSQGFEQLVQNVNSQQFTEGMKDVNSRKKRGAFVRKKTDRSKSNSPTGVERPKKKN